MYVEPELTYGIFDEFAPTESGDSFDSREIVDVLLDCETIEEGVILGTVSDKFTHFLKVALQVHPLDRNRAAGGFFLGREHLKRCRLASTVDSEECKALTLTQAKG